MPTVRADLPITARGGEADPEALLDRSHATALATATDSNGQTDRRVNSLPAPENEGQPNTRAADALGGSTLQ